MTLKLRVLSEEEQQVIEKVSRSRTVPAWQVERAKIIQVASQGQTIPQIARQLRVKQNTVRKWFARFGERGLQGLQDAPRSGAPVTYSAEDQARIIATALSKPSEVGESYASWTFGRLASHVQEKLGIPMKKTRIFELLQAEGLRWRKQETWFGERVDPDFAEKRGALKPSAAAPLNTVPSSTSTKWDR
jgi:transposase